MRKRLWPMLLVFTVLLAVPVVPALAGFAGTDLFILMAGRGAGAYPSNWFTTVYLYNPNPTAVTVDLTFLERNKDNVATAPPRVTETLAAGETRVYDNIVEATFSRTAYGALRIQCAQKVVASARVFSKESADAPLTQSFGQDFAATPASFAIGVGESTDILGGYSTLPYQYSAARFNIGCVETTGLGSATVRWVARDGAGQQQKQYDRVVPRLSQTQGFFHQYFDGIDLTNSRVSASVISGGGRVICYGSLVTNDQELPKPVQDPTTFEMVYKDSLLGIAAVQHDATLQGDGTTAAPLGLADGAVSKGKVAAAGGAAGQVLATDGAQLLWATPATGGLVLPYAGSGSTAGAAPLFSLVNLGTGVGLQVDSDGGTRRGALVSSDAGVYGHTMMCGGEHRGVLGLSTCTGAYGELGRPGVGVLGDGYAYGVHGRSADGDGVFGVSSASNKSGVFAVNDNPAGWAGFFRGRVGIAGAVECTGCIVEADLAGGSVSRGKLAASGAGSSGQVLGTDGSGLVWQSASGFSLPFWGEGIDANAAFRARNTYVGPTAVGVRGESVSDWGVMGSNTTGGAGYLGGPVSGVEGYGSERGVAGQATSTYGIGVYGKVGGGLPGLRNTYQVGVYGDAGGVGVGVLGSSHTYGVFGTSDDGYGVEGQTRDGLGVHGRSWGSGTAVEGDGSAGGVGVRGISGPLDGVRGESAGAGKSGVYGVNSDGSGYGVFGRNSASGNWGSLGAGSHAGDFGGPVRVSGLGGGGDVYADANGVLTLGGGSDARLKTAVVDLGTELDLGAVLLGLRGVAFNWDSFQERAKDLGERREIGLIAQEVEAVLPHVVGETPDGYKTVDYAKLTALLIEVAKAQAARLEAQQAEMGALREAVVDLSARYERLEAGR